MTEGKRPGGLTALAVLNFIGGVFAVFGGLGNFALAAGLPKMREMAEANDDADLMRFVEALERTGPDLIMLMAAISLLAGVLLIVSGVGYLKQKKFLGRTLGSVWAVLSIVSNVVSVMSMEEAVGGGMSLMVLVFLIYPLLTLILLNTTFKEDFVR